MLKKLSLIGRKAKKEIIFKVLTSGRAGDIIQARRREYVRKNYGLS